MSKKASERVIREELERKLSQYFNTTVETATKDQIYKATVMTVKDRLTSMRAEYKKDIKKVRGKRIVYLCMEFLLGRQLKNNLCNLGIAEDYRKALADIGVSLDEL